MLRIFRDTGLNSLGLLSRQVAMLVLIGAVLSSSQNLRAQVDETRAHKIVTGSCFVCHGLDGEATTEIFPILAGQHWQYIARQLQNFKDGRRKSTAMVGMVQKLTSEEMDALGRYFEKKNLARQESIDSVLAQQGKVLYHAGVPSRGIPACASCHGGDAMGGATLPRLAGQHAVYTAAQLKDFARKKRRDDTGIMSPIAANLSSQEIDALAQYLAGK